MEGELCRLCGGDGRIGNALGRSTATCPGCHGSGRRGDTSTAFHDVTKTKPSHHQRPEAASAKGPRGPTTSEGVQLARPGETVSVELADLDKYRRAEERIDTDNRYDNNSIRYKGDEATPTPTPDRAPSRVTPPSDAARPPS